MAHLVCLAALPSHCIPCANIPDHCSPTFIFIPPFCFHSKGISLTTETAPAPPQAKK